MKSFRLPESLLKRLDRYVERERRETRNVALARADVVRIILTKWLDEAERRK